MKIFLIGGSNTRSKDGWSPGFAKRVARERPADVVTNLSVGATSSVLGTWRIINDAGLRPGDVVVWEYALNDMTYIAMQPELEPVLLSNIEQMIRFCARRRLRLAPLIFAPKPNGMRAQLSTYHRELLRLFRVYSVEVFDLTIAFRQHLGRKNIPAHHYENRVHYLPGDEIIDFTIDGALGLVSRAEVPRPRRRPVWEQALRPLEELTGFEGGNRGVFENSMLSLPTFQIPEDGTLKISLPRAGRIAAIIHFATASGTPVRASIGSETRVMSTRIDEKFFSKPLLKAFIWEGGGAPFRFSAGDVLHLAYAPGEDAQINPGYRVATPSEDGAQEDGEGSFCAVLAEYEDSTVPSS